MRNLCSLILLVLVGLIWGQYTTFAQTAKTYEFVNGNWFDGKTFKKTKFYSVSGVLTTKRPEQIDENLDLKNGFVIPPLADAHCHHFDSSNAAEQINTYLRDGVFYAKVLTNWRVGAQKVADMVNKPASVDVSYAHGGLTHSYGHPMRVYEALAAGIYNFDDQTAAKVRENRRGENDAYYIVDTIEDLEKKWQTILDGKPNFIKIYLLTSEDFADKKKNLARIPLGVIGLDPQIVPAIVKKAHAAGLRVSAHVDTVTDYRIALNAGVDEMAHLPGYYSNLEDKPEKFLLTATDARETARRKVYVVPAPIYDQYMNQAVRKKTDDVLRQNLTLLKQNKVKIAFASDRYGSTPVDDVFHIATLDVFSNLDILKIWCEQTPQTIFPRRKIGRLNRGYEASFIVLGQNPLEKLTAIKNINFRFKQGFVLDVPSKQGFAK